MIKLQAPGGILLCAIAGTYLPATGGTHLSATGGTPRASRAHILLPMKRAYFVQELMGMGMAKFGESILKMVLKSVFCLMFQNPFLRQVSLLMDNGYFLLEVLLFNLEVVFIGIPTYMYA